MPNVPPLCYLLNVNEASLTAFSTSLHKRSGTTVVAGITPPIHLDSVLRKLSAYAANRNKSAFGNSRIAIRYNVPIKRDIEPDS